MLGSFFGLNGGRDHLGQLLLLSDVLTDGSFLVHHFITQALRDGHHTILVSLTQSLLHYSSVCSKLGVNTHKKREEGSFVFVDGLSSLLTQAFTASVPPNTSPGSQDGAGREGVLPPNSSSPGSQDGGRVVLSLDRDCCLKGVLQTLQQLISEAGKQEKPVCLVIDGLSVLLSVGVPLCEVVLLVQTCTHLLTSTSGPCQGEGYLVVMVHCEQGGEKEPEHFLHSHLLHLCHLHLQAKGLATGYSRDIHGQVSVSWRDPACTGQDLASPQTAQYKLTDKSVQIFATGMSTAIL